MTRLLRWWAMLVICNFIGTIFGQPGSASTTQSATLEDPIVKTDGVGGCTRIQVGDSKTLRVIAAGKDIDAPARIDVDWSTGLALGVQSHMLFAPPRMRNPPRASTDTPILYAMWPRDAMRTSWNSGYYYSLQYGIATMGDTAILDGGDTFLLATVRWRAPVDSAETVVPNVRPFHVRKFTTPPHPTRPTNLGEPLASFETDGVAAQIELSADGSVAHIVTDRHVVHSISTDTLTEIAPPISIPPITGLQTMVLGTTIAFLRADLAPDDRHLVVNQGRTGNLTLVDLEARTARTVSVHGVEGTGRRLGPGWPLS